MTEENGIENHNMRWFWATYYGPFINYASHTVCPNSDQTFDVTDACDDPQCPQKPLFDSELFTLTP